MILYQADTHFLNNLGEIICGKFACSVAALVDLVKICDVEISKISPSYFLQCSSYSENLRYKAYSRKFNAVLWIL